MPLPTAIELPGADPKSSSVYSFQGHSTNLQVNSRGVAQSVYDEVDPATYLGPRGRRETVVNAQGLTLRVYYWPAEQPKAILQFVHGHGAHALFELLEIDVRGGVLVDESWGDCRFSQNPIWAGGTD